MILFILQGPLHQICRNDRLRRTAQYTTKLISGNVLAFGAHAAMDRGVAGREGEALLNGMKRCGAGVGGELV